MFFFSSRGGWDKNLWQPKNKRESWCARKGFADSAMSAEGEIILGWFTGKLLTSGHPEYMKHHWDSKFNTVTKICTRNGTNKVSSRTSQGIELFATSTFCKQRTCHPRSNQPREHTPEIPRPLTTCWWRESFHIRTWGCSGYVPRVCGIFLRNLASKSQDQRSATKIKPHQVRPSRSNKPRPEKAGISSFFFGWNRPNNLRPCVGIVDFYDRHLHVYFDGQGPKVGEIWPKISFIFASQKIQGMAGVGAGRGPKETPLLHPRLFAFQCSTWRRSLS